MPRGCIYPTCCGGGLYPSGRIYTACWCNTVYGYYHIVTLQLHEPAPNLTTIHWLHSKVCTQLHVMALRSSSHWPLFPRNE